MNTPKALIPTLLLVAASIAGASDPTWLAAIAPNSAGGVLELSSLQRPPCKGDWYNAATTRPQIKEKVILRGCWKFDDTGVLATWENGKMTHYDVTQFHWSDWAVEKTPPASAAPKSKIEHKSSDIIT